MRDLVVALAVAATFASPSYARTQDDAPSSYGARGHEVAAPPWSFACMTDHGPAACGEPIWVYH